MWSIWRGLRRGAGVDVRVEGVPAKGVVEGVVPVGEMVEKRGIKFNMTLDHSHVMFKIDNPREQEVQGMRADIEAGRLELNPFKPNDVCTQWINRNWIAHCHARAAAPNNPVNVWAKYPDGRFGRGVQYPFRKPGPGEWHSEWKEENLEPWKEVLRRLLRFNATDPKGCLGQITTEFLVSTDYGAGAKYSIWQDSIAACIQRLEAATAADDVFAHRTGHLQRPTARRGNVVGLFDVGQVHRSRRAGGACRSLGTGRARGTRRTGGRRSSS